VGPDEGRLKGLPDAQLACNARLLASTSDLPHRDHIAIFISQTGCTRHANTVDGTPDRIRIQMCMSCGCRRLRMPEEFSNGREAQAAAHRYAGKAVSEKRRPTSIPNRSRTVLDRTPHFKRNSGGRVIFGWNCTLQDVTSHASNISALRLIASGKWCRSASGRHSLPAIIRTTRPRVSRSKVLSWEVSRSGSLMRNYSVTRQRANLTRH
jgi:hypothetical protein